MDQEQKEAANLAQQLKPFWLVASAVFGLVTFSTVFYHYVEKWDWLDSYYFTIVTIATVGYGDYTPKTDIGKFVATILIIIGIGLFGTFANLLIKRQALKRAERLERKIKKDI